MPIDAFLEQLQAAGIRIELQGQELKIQAPKGVMNPEIQAQLKARKSELIAYLQTKHVLNPSAIKLSLFFFGTESATQANPGNKYKLILDAAQLADQLGFYGIWTPERHFHDLGGLFPNPAVLSAALAMVTQKLKIRAGSVVLPLQDPIRVAEEWAMVDQLSQGRVELSFASGWHANDFALAPDNYFERHQILYQRLQEVQNLWQGQSLTRKSGGGHEIRVQSFPRPVQHSLPIWLTAIGNPASYQRIGETGSGLLTALLDQSIEELAEKLPVYHQAVQSSSASRKHSQIAVFMHTYIGQDREQVKALVRQPFKAYLSQTLNLLGNLSKSLGVNLNPEDFSPQEQDTLLDFAFERYFEERSLMGDINDARRRIQQLQAIGVNEIACLIDFGLPDETVLEGIQQLAQVIQGQ